jgi:GT2 family glycosyltransferase/glycosyltransferase involved in cell wall biosynthesis
MDLMKGQFRYRKEGLLDETHLRFFTRQSALDFLARNGWQVVSVDEIVLQLHESEFAPSLSGLPDAVVQHLADLPDALVYQYIIEAVPSSRIVTRYPHGNEVDPHRDSPVFEAHSVTVYWGDESGFSESRKHSKWGRLGTNLQQFQFPFPEPVRTVTRVRLDPGDRPGYLHIYSISLNSAGGGALWQWDRQSESLKASASQHILFGKTLTGGGASLLMDGNDAYIVLPIPMPLLAELPSNCYITVELGWPMSSDFLVFLEKLSGRDRLIAQQSIDERELKIQIETLSSQLAEQQKYRRANDQLVVQCKHLASLLQNCVVDTSKALDDVSKLKAYVESIEQSTVFRLTRPLVQLKMTFDRMANLFYTSAKSSEATESSSTISNGHHLTLSDVAVDIVVPVYRGFIDTRRCIESVLSSYTATPYRLVIVNDASPEPDLVEYLRTLSQSSEKIVLLENPKNLGFVGSVNLGMEFSARRDVVLLNSDTEVADEWLDRLRTAAYSDGRVASVTPLSNNATICSYPRFCNDNEIPYGFDTSSLNELCANVNRGVYVDIPTAVGFCMYIRRDCLQEIGLFDVEHFGKGYGEENDFCMRSSAKGWHHLLTTDTFVRHLGGGSFGESKREREIAAFQTLRSLHPHYEQVVHEHVTSDPAKTARINIDLARLGSSTRTTILMITHSRGGGTDRHVIELAEQLHDTSNVLALRPADNGTMLLTWLNPGEEHFKLWFRIPNELEQLTAALQTALVSHIHIHHLLGVATEVLSLPMRLNVSYDFTIHDYYSICPQITLTTNSNKYCGERGVDQCHKCLSISPAPEGRSITQWRNGFNQLLIGARYVFAPSNDCGARIENEYPAANIVIVPHTDLNELSAPPAWPVLFEATKPLRIVVIGALSSIKGADLLEEVAREAKTKNAPIEFHLIGYSYRQLATQPMARLSIYGPYEESDLESLLMWLKPDLAWFPAQWPETYSYTLSAALKTGLPIVAPNIGAFPERLTGRSWSWIIPWDQTSAEWVRFFSYIRSEHFITSNPPSPYSGSNFPITLYNYKHQYLTGISCALPPNIRFVPKDNNLNEFSRGSDATQTYIKRRTLVLLFWLRNQRALRAVSRLIPLRWQTRIKTWLTS